MAFFVSFEDGKDPTYTEVVGCVLIDTENADEFDNPSNIEGVKKYSINKMMKILQEKGLLEDCIVY